MVAQTAVENLRSHSLSDSRRDSNASNGSRSTISTTEAIGGRSIKERRPSVKSQMTVESTGCLEKAFFLTSSEIHPILCCGINMGVMEDPVRTPCDHLFCDYCIRQVKSMRYCLPIQSLSRTRGNTTTCYHVPSNSATFRTFRSHCEQWHHIVSLVTSKCAIHGCCFPSIIVRFRPIGCTCSCARTKFRQRVFTAQGTHLSSPTRLLKIVRIAADHSFHLASSFGWYAVA